MSNVSLSGPVVEAGAIQPFDVAMLRDDLHAIAFLADHPRYESIEAMARRMSSGVWRVRVVLTRRDQTQVDVLNDAAGFAPMAGLARERVLRPMTVEASLAGPCPWLAVGFEGCDTAAVRFSVAAVHPPSAAHGGVTDPGLHAIASGLPLMVRARSALATPMTRVRIDGRCWPVARAFVSLGHGLAIVRAGTRRLRLLEQPAELRPGACWRYASLRGPCRYRIVGSGSGSDGRLAVVGDGPQPVAMTIRVMGRRMMLETLRVSEASSWIDGASPGDDVPAGGARISFGPDARFEIVLDGHPDGIRGRWQQPSPAMIRLVPESPAWAKSRVVVLSIDHGVGPAGEALAAEECQVSTRMATSGP